MIKPKRPLTAYNLFFRSERAKLVGENTSAFDNRDIPKKRRAHRKTHGKIGFMDLARTIGQRWNQLDPETRVTFEMQAVEERKRYKENMVLYRQALRVAGGVEKRNQSTSSKPTFSLPQKPLFSCVGSQGISDKFVCSPSSTAPNQYYSTLSKALALCESNNEANAFTTGSSLPHSGLYGGSISDVEKDLIATLGDEVIDFLSNLSDIEDTAPTDHTTDATTHRNDGIAGLSEPVTSQSSDKSQIATSDSFIDAIDSVLSSATDDRNTDCFDIMKFSGSCLFG